VISQVDIYAADEEFVMAILKGIVMERSPNRSPQLLMRPQKGLVMEKSALPLGPLYITVRWPHHHRSPAIAITVRHIRYHWVFPFQLFSV